jgi:4'-phosphopantetheinyl transferase
MNAAGVVHLACAEVAALLRDAPGAMQWLSASEARRLAALKTERRRSQFLAARWQARGLLARVFGGSPGDWPLEAPPDAPPRLAQRADLFLSISHSGERTACAVAGAPVGLDLEQPRRRRDVAGLVALCCTPGEQALFAGLAASEGEALFYELWTVKEAWLKERGEWIAPRRLAQVDAMPGPQGQVRTWRAEDWQLAVTAREVRWWTAEPAVSRTWTVRDGHS